MEVVSISSLSTELNMNKYITVALILFVFLLEESRAHLSNRESFSLSDQIQMLRPSGELIDTIYHYVSKEPSYQKELSSITIYFYDIEGILQERLGQRWVTGLYENDWKETWEYDSDGHEIGWEYTEWNGTLWAPKERIEHLYGSDSELLSYAYFQGIMPNGDWRKKEKRSYSYQNILLAEEVVQVGEPSLNIWIHSEKMNRTYDGQDRLIEKRLSSWSNTTSNWSFIERIRYIYESGGQLDETSFDIWDDSNNDWQENSRIVYSYDTNGWRIEESLQRLLGSQWEDSTRLAFIYNNDGRELERLEEHWLVDSSMWVRKNKQLRSYDLEGNENNVSFLLWNEITGAWVPDSQYLAVFNTMNQPIEEVYKTGEGNLWIPEYRFLKMYNENDNLERVCLDTWDTDSLNWRNRSEDLYVYKSVVVSDIDIDQEVGKLLVYPIPANHICNVEIPDILHSDFEMRIHALDGRLIKYVGKFRGGERAKFNVRALGIPSGGYLIELKDKDGKKYLNRLLIK